ncbi:MAG: DNA ligase D, partial [Caulobacterales bacterium]
STGDTEALVFYVFDLLFLNGADLRTLPLSERKAQLEKLVKGGKGIIRYIPHVKNPGADVHKAACEMNMEGIVSKQLDAPYRSGRGDSWQKSKCRAGQEIVIGGWTEVNGRFKSLLAGVNRDGKFVYVGRIGTGYGRAVVSRLVPELKKVAAKTSPFEGDAVPRGPETIKWAKPVLIAEVEFAGWTGDGALRQAAFKGLRQDKPASEIVQEKPMATKAAATASKSAPRSAAAKSGPMKVLGVAISHPEKILWPATDDQPEATKADLANYFEAIAERILPHIKGRPCSIIRTPDGIGGQSFFQRHAGKGSSDLITEVKVRGDKEPYIQFDTAAALIAAAQSGATELHPWNCQPGDPETPGRLVFDLDPAPDVDFSAVIDGAKEIRDRLTALGMTSFCKTTGGKGLHVVAPLAKPKKGELRWPEAKGFAQEVCRQMAADSPELYLINMAKKARVGKIFLDYLRNDRTSTAVAPYSPRARPGATVSMPVAWSQVRKGLDPQKFNIRSVPALVKKADPWAEYCDVEADFVKAAKKLLKK